MRGMPTEKEQEQEQEQEEEKKKTNEMANALNENEMLEIIGIST